MLSFRSFHGDLPVFLVEYLEQPSLGPVIIMWLTTVGDQLHALYDVSFKSAPILALCAALLAAILALLVRQIRSSRVMSKNTMSEPEKALEEVVVDNPEYRWQQKEIALPFPTIRPEKQEADETSKSTQVQAMEIPRRRSYTKTVQGVEMQGEIIVAEGWKRHTRVYGGGVCEACLESERRMKKI